MELFSIRIQRTFQLVSTGKGVEDARFFGKIRPAGLEIFPENRRLDLAFPSIPEITFAARTEMAAKCGC